MKKKFLLFLPSLQLLAACGGRSPYVPPVDGQTAESAVLYRACDDEKPEKVTLTGEEIDGAVAAVSGMTAVADGTSAACPPAARAIRWRFALRTERSGCASAMTRAEGSSA